MLQAVSIAILSLYTVLIGVALLGWLLTKSPVHRRRSPSKSPPAWAEGWGEATVIIPARDEAHNLPALLHDLAQQTYGLVEVMVVDDHSTDQTAEFVRKHFRNAPALNGRLLELGQEQGKKAALELGIRQARGPLIVTTDADCRVGPRWVETMLHHAADSGMILGPVSVKSHSPLSAFQAFDILVLMLFTAASTRFGRPILANGANLALTKDAFETAGGYGEHRRISSGDDVLLMQRLAGKHGTRSIRFVKHRDAIVSTSAVRGVQAFLHQRARWLSKGRHMTTAAKVLMGSGYTIALGLATTAIWAVADGSPEPTIAVLGIIAASITGVAVAVVANFFRKMRLLIWLPLLVPAYLLYVVAMPILTSFIRPVWKGRPVRR